MSFSKPLPSLCLTSSAPSRSLPSTDEIVNFTSQHTIPCRPEHLILINDPALRPVIVAREVVADATTV